MNKKPSIHIVQGPTNHAIYRDGQLVAVKSGDGVGIPAIMDSLKTAGLYEKSTDMMPLFDLKSHRLTDELAEYPTYFGNLTGHISVL